MGVVKESVQTLHLLLAMDWHNPRSKRSTQVSQENQQLTELTVNSVKVITAVIPLSNQPLSVIRYPLLLTHPTEPAQHFGNRASAKCSKEILLKTPDPGRAGDASGTKASESDSYKFRLAASVGALDCDSVSPDRQSGGKWDGN